MPQNREEGAAGAESGLNLSEASAPDGGDSPSPEGARAAHRSYYRWLRASRPMMAACLALAALFFLWILPWLFSGFLPSHAHAHRTPSIAYDPSGNGEGETRLGFDTATTDASGKVAFMTVLGETASVGEFITTTATVLRAPTLRSSINPLAD